MSIGLGVAIIVLMLAVFYFRRRQAGQVAALAADPPRPAQAGSGLELPSGYCFHPGHTWMAEQSREVARVGIDFLAANVLGEVHRIVVIGEQRWVRQGQKIMTLTRDSVAVDMLSPLEGVVTAINPEVVRHPELAVRDPYGAGWVCVIKSPELETNRRNLMQGNLAWTWMQNSLRRLKSMLAKADPALAQDGGLPIPGALSKLSPEMRRQVVNEFFLT